MPEYSVAFTDSEHWIAAIEVEAPDSFEAVRIALNRIDTTERGKKLSDISKIEIDLT